MYELFANHREEMYDKLIRAEMNQRGEINKYGLSKSHLKRNRKPTTSPYSVSIR